MLYIITSITFIIIGFVNLSPQFGSNPPKKDVKSFTEFDNFKNREFINLEKTVPNSLWGEKISTSVINQKEIDFMHFKSEGHDLLA